MRKLALATHPAGALDSHMEGLMTIASKFTPKETMNRLEAEVRVRGLTVFARIDHAAGAAEVGLTLRPTELIIFGNARSGTSSGFMDMPRAPDASVYRTMVSGPASEATEKGRFMR